MTLSGLLKKPELTVKKKNFFFFWVRQHTKHCKHWQVPLPGKLFPGLLRPGPSLQLASALTSPPQSFPDHPTWKKPHPWSGLQ